MQETILLLRRQLSSLSDKSASGATSLDICSDEQLKKNPGESKIASCSETYADENTPTSVMSLNRILSLEDSKECNFNSQIYMQVISVLLRLCCRILIVIKKFANV